MVNPRKKHSHEIFPIRKCHSQSIAWLHIHLTNPFFVGTLFSSRTVALKFYERSCRPCMNDIQLMTTTWADAPALRKGARHHSHRVPSSHGANRTTAKCHSNNNLMLSDSDLAFRRVRRERVTRYTKCEHAALNGSVRNISLIIELATERSGGTLFIRSRSLNF